MTGWQGALFGVALFAAVLGMSVSSFATGKEKEAKDHAERLAIHCRARALEPRPDGLGCVGVLP